MLTWTLLIARNSRYSPDLHAVPLRLLRSTPLSRIHEVVAASTGSAPSFHFGRTRISWLRTMRKAAMRGWLPVLAGSTAVALVLMMWQTLVREERRQVVALVRQHADGMGRSLSRHLTDRARLMERVADQWTHDAKWAPASGSRKAQQVARDFPGMLGLARADRAGVLRWQSSDRGTGGLAVGDRLDRLPGGSDAIRLADVRGTTHSTESRSLLAGERGTLLITPIRGSAERRGYVVGALTIQPVVDSALGEDVSRGFGFLIRDGATMVYARERADLAGIEQWRVDVPVDAPGREWTMSVVPTKAFISRSTSRVADLFVIAGLLFAVVIGCLVRVAQRYAALVKAVASGNQSRRTAERARDASAGTLAQQAHLLQRQNADQRATAATLELQRAATEEAQELRVALVHSIPDAVAAFDAYGCVSAWNPRMVELTGREESEVDGLMIGDLLPFLSKGHEVTLLLEALAGRPTQLPDVEAIQPLTIAPVWLDVSVTPMRAEDGRILGGLLVARDVTERKRLSDGVLAGKLAAEEANRAKSDFLARMSHELRTPLNSVIGFTNVLRRNKSGRLDRDEITYLERINSNGRHLLGMINEVLDLAKIESGRETVFLEDVSVAALVRDTVSDLNVRACGASVRLVADVPAGSFRARTDEAKLKQVLINLIGNAIKFTPADGAVTVVVRTEDVACGTIYIEVRDTGIGIPADRLSAIFEAFEQVDTDTARHFGGTGLGLAISRQLCSLMGHELAVRSELGAGSTFSIIIRRDAAMVAAA